MKWKFLVFAVILILVAYSQALSQAKVKSRASIKEDAYQEGNSNIRTPPYDGGTLPGGEFPIDMNSNEAREPIEMAIRKLSDELDMNEVNTIGVERLFGQVVAGMIYYVHAKIVFINGTTEKRIVKIFRSLSGRYSYMN